MINQSTLELLKAMKLTAMANELQHQMEDPATYAALGFEDRLSLLTDAEWGRRQANKLARYIKNATFSTPSASIEGIEYHDDRKLDKAEILRYATCQYIIDGHHIILKGASGNGKTYLACALGNAACRKFYAVKYIRMPELLDELNVAKGCGDLKKTIKAYQKVDLLILDEWLIRTLTRRNPMTCLRLPSQDAQINPPSFVLSMNRWSGIHALLQQRLLEVLFQKQSWIESFITHTKF